MVLSATDEKILLINAYFPTDSRTNINDELITTLQDIKYLLDAHSPGCKVIVMGDLNCDLSRDTNFVRTVKHFLDTNNLVSVWTLFNCDFTYSQSREVNGVLLTSFSAIDHFLVSSEDLVNCVDAEPLHHASNMSNHDPIFLKFKLLLHPNRKTSRKITPVRRPCWKKSNASPN